MKSIKVLLWLDDVRAPSKEQWREVINGIYPLENESCYYSIKLVKSYDEFISFIENNGLPYHIFFDHDLADEHYTPREVWEKETYHKWSNEQEFKEKTGMDCAKWLVDYCMNTKNTLPNFSSHSANPYGRENILGLLSNYKKLVDIN